VAGPGEELHIGIFRWYTGIHWERKSEGLWGVIDLLEEVEFVVIVVTGGIITAVYGAGGNNFRRERLQEKQTGKTVGNQRHDLHNPKEGNGKKEGALFFPHKGVWAISADKVGIPKPKVGNFGDPNKTLPEKHYIQKRAI